MGNNTVINAPYEARYMTFEESVRRFNAMPLERYLQLALWHNPDLVWPGLKWVGWEITLRTGRVDLIGMFPGGAPCVCEIKTDCLDEKALLQVIRYRNALRELQYQAWESSICPLTRYPFPNAAPFGPIGAILIGSKSAHHINKLANEHDVMVFHYSKKPRLSLKQIVPGPRGWRHKKLKSTNEELKNALWGGLT